MRPSAAYAASRVFPIPGSPESSTTCRDTAARAALRPTISARAHAPARRTPNRGTEPQHRRQRPRAQPSAPPPPAANHDTANASIGSVNPFNSNSPDRLEPDTLDPARQRLVTGETQDPVRRCLVTQPRRLDRRHPKVIAVLHRRLARPQPDPNMQLLLSLAIAPLEQLLHRHRTPTAADADENATINPSPVFLTSRPPEPSIASRSSREILIAAAHRPAPDRPPSPTASSRPDPSARIVASSTDSANKPPRIGPRNRPPEYSRTQQHAQSIGASSAPSREPLLSEQAEAPTR